MKRIILFGTLPLFMAGCVPLIPLPISIMTSGLSGLSFLTTGKSTTDHVISAANKQDCVMHRVAFGEEICRRYGAGEYRPDTQYSNHFPGDLEQDPQLEDSPNNWGGDENTAELPEKTKESPKVDPLLISSLTNPIRVDTDVSIDFAKLQPSSPSEPASDIEFGGWNRPAAPISVESLELPPLPQIRPSSETLVSNDGNRRFLSLGSFRSADRADVLRKRFAFLSPTVMTIEVGGKTWRRVAVGPLAKSEADRLRRSHPRIDGRDTWTFVR
jgi:hypothetical protein